MTQYELLARLVNEGFAAQQFCVLAIGLARNEGPVLEQEEGRFAIFYYERGQRGDILFSAASEHDVCNHYYTLVSREPSVLLMVGTTSSALEIQALLSSHNIQSNLQKIPASVFGAKKIQVVVAGRDLGAARHALLFSTQQAAKKWWQFWN